MTRDTERLARRRESPPPPHPRTLTLDFVVFRVGGEGPVGEEVVEADARVLRLVHHVVPDSLHQSVHKLQAGRAQNLNHLVPLVDVCTTRPLWKNKTKQRITKKKKP